MRSVTNKRRRWLSEEEAFKGLSEVFDFELFCLEIEYNEKIGDVIREGVKKALDEKQRAFDAMLASHPATLAVTARRAEARRLERERLEGIAARRRARERRAVGAGVERLARRWDARLVRRAG